MPPRLRLEAVVVGLKVREMPGLGRTPVCPSKHEGMEGNLTGKHFMEEISPCAELRAT